MNLEDPASILIAYEKFALAWRKGSAYPPCSWVVTSCRLII